jgi:dipeptidyl aminopeptidase/acylaminoacyl peptidase
LQTPRKSDVLEKKEDDMPKRQIQTSDIVKNHQVSGPKLSPDRKRLLFLRNSYDMDADASTATMRICNTDGSEARDFGKAGVYSRYDWSPDGRAVAYLKQIDEQLQLFIAPLDGGEPRQVTSRSVSDFCWSPEASRVVVVRALPDESKLTNTQKNAPDVITSRFYKLDGLGIMRKRQHLFVIDLATGKEKQVTRGDWNCRAPCWSPDGRTICFVSDRHRDRWDRFQMRSALWLVSADGGTAERITPETGAAAPAYSPDGKWIAYVGQLEPYGQADDRQANLIITDHKGKVHRNVTNRHDMFVMAGQWWMDALCWRGDSKKLWFTGLHSIARGSIRQLSTGDQSIEGIAVGSDRVWMATGWLNRLQEIYSSALDDWSPKRLTNENREITQAVKFGRARRFSFKASDGLAIEGFLVFPPNYKRGRRWPMLMNVHGGPHGYHPVTVNPLMVQAKAAAGYVVFLPNPRGSITYGDDFMQRVVGSWGEEDFEDLMSGVDRLVSLGIAHPDKLYIEGYSYGGFMSSWVVGRDHRFKAAVIGAPLTDMTSAWATSDINTYLSGELQLSAPHDDSDAYQDKSPLSYVKNVKTPSMLVHWAGDTRCPVGQSEQFYLALKTLKRKTEFVLYPGGSHGNRTPSQMQDFVERSLDWFSRHR